MRALVFVLILGNLLFFAYAQGYFGHPVSPDALRQSQQINPDDLKLLPPTANAPSAEGAAGTVAVGAPLEPAKVPPAPPPPAPNAPDAVVATPVPTTAPVPAAPAEKQNANACVLVAGLPAEEAERLAIRAAEGGLSATRRDEGGWWVFMPPKADKKAADKKAAELQALGIGDFFIVTDGPQKFAISLGVFSREEAANKHLEQLRGKGVKTALVGARSVEHARQQVEVKGSANLLEPFRKGLPAGVVSKDCP